MQRLLTVSTSDKVKTTVHEDLHTKIKMQKEHIVSRKTAEGEGKWKRSR